MIIPNCNTHFDVPTIGDSVTIPSDLSVDIPKEEALFTGFQIAIQPKIDGNGIRSQGKVIAILLNSIRESVVNLVKIIGDNEISEADAEASRVLLKNSLENHRSVLDYVSHYIGGFCSPVPKSDKIQFPIANVKESKKDFVKKLDKWFPNLKNEKNDLFNYLVEVQHFDGDTWLSDLAKLTNVSKHRTLLAQTKDNFKTLVIDSGGCALKVGEFGFSKIIAEPRGKVIFKDADGGAVELVGPFEITVDSINCPNINSNFKISFEIHNILKIDGMNQSSAAFLGMLNINVMRVVNRICVLLS